MPATDAVLTVITDQPEEDRAKVSRFVGQQARIQSNGQGNIMVYFHNASSAIVQDAYEVLKDEGFTVSYQMADPLS